MKGAVRAHLGRYVSPLRGDLAVHIDDATRERGQSAVSDWESANDPDYNVETELSRAAGYSMRCWIRALLEARP